MTERQQIDENIYNNAKFIETKVGNKTFNLPEIEKNDGKTFRFWTNAGVVFDHVWNYVLKEFPDDILVPEVDRVDIMNLSKNIPIEIQSTVLTYTKSESKVKINHSQFFSHVTITIKSNLAQYGKCWFFFDWDYFDYIIDGLGRGAKFNLQTLFEQFEPDCVKVFVVRSNGDIKELKSTDYQLTASDEETILYKNRIKILKEIFQQFRFTSTEIKEYRDIYFEETHQKDRFLFWLQSQKDDERAYLLGKILSAANRLGDINTILDRKKRSFNTWFTYTTYAARALGIIFYDNMTKKYGFSDLFSMCKYFPAYQRNEAFWTSLNGKKLNRRQFNEIVFNKGATKLEDYTDSTTEALLPGSINK